MRSRFNYDANALVVGDSGSAKLDVRYVRIHHQAVVHPNNVLLLVEDEEGDDAFVANEWFHAAVTYNGNENTADNLNLYWTRVDSSRTEANLIGSHSMEDLSTTGVAIYGVGNDFRTVGSGNSGSLDGSIDEVRISGIARGADDMLFSAVPEPSALALLGLGSVALLARRRLRVR